MKPHLIRRDGIWTCGIPVFRFDVPMGHCVRRRPIGYGHTPDEAYDDWKQRKEQIGAIA